MPTSPADQPSLDCGPAAVRACGLGKCYHVYDSPQDRVKQALFGRRRRYYNEFWALRGASFDVPQGSAFAVIGSNGSGKSTLLQILAGIQRQTEGEFSVTGRVGGLIELGAGFNPEFTGEENARMQCALLGLDGARIGELLPRILEFSELGDFFGKPVKTYSSGMQVRLGFACQALLEPDVLLADEVLAVGDLHFQWKCLGRIRELRERGCTVLLVTHDTTTVLSFCDRALWLDAGRVVRCGANVPEIVAEYTDFQRARAAGPAVTPPMFQEAEACPCLEEPGPVDAPGPDGPDSQVPQASEAGQGIAAILEVEVLDGRGEPSQVLPCGGEMRVRVRFRLHRRVPGCVAGVAIFDSRREMVFGTNNRIDGVAIGEEPGVHECEIRYPKLPLNNGEYTLDVGIFDSQALARADYLPRAAQFRVEGGYQGLGAVILEHSWSTDGHG